MSKVMNSERLQQFKMRRRMNMLGLFALTVISAAVTAVCALLRFERTGIIAVVTALFAALCFVQMFKIKKSFRTIRAFRGIRKKKKE